MQAVLNDNSVFEKKLNRFNIPLTRNRIGTLQLNITRKCNQACTHCHVNAGPKRSEMMERKTIDRILELLFHSSEINTVDITGGAPELNPYFRYLIKELKSMNKRIIDRCNLTILLEEGQEDTIEFFSQNQVHIVASMPCYLEENVDKQRGDSVFKKSLNALKNLNATGYGYDESGLTLDLVYNPAGCTLPPDQSSLECDYKNYMRNNYNIEFNRLITMTNMPINRFKNVLIKEGRYESYINFLMRSFNPAAASKVMCKELLSIAWDGTFYDCDFNQSMGIHLKENRKTVWDIKDFTEISPEISFGDHCFACTAGNGSSCGGVLV